MWKADAAQAVVVLVHGLAASSDDSRVVRQAEALCADGFDVVSYDARGHGRSEGRSTLGDLESYDVAAAVTWAKQSGLPVVVVGASMGAVAALRYAADADEGVLAGVVTISAPASWQSHHSASAMLMVAATRTHLGRRVAGHRMGVRITPTWTPPAPPSELAGRLKVPLAVIQGDRDRYIPTTDAEEIYRASTSTHRRLDVIAGMGHAFDANALPAVSTAVQWVLEQTAAP